MSLSRKVLSMAVLVALAGTAAASPAERALDLIQANPGHFKATAADKFAVRNSQLNGQVSTVRLDRTYKGLEVFEGDVVMQISGEGSLKSSNMTLKAPLNLDTTPSINRQDAIVAAGAHADTFTQMPSAKLVVSNHGTQPTLAWKVQIDGSNDTSVTYFIGAGASNGGQLLFSVDNHQTTDALGTAKTLYSGNVTIGTNSIAGGYELRDNVRGGGTTVNGAKGKTSGTIYTDSDNIWGNNAVTDLASAAVDAHYGVAVTFDYYKAVHGRNGIKNNGVGAENRVHYGHNYVNAYWSDSCFCMTYGDGDGVTYGPLVDLDVAGHEMSHGVMASTANLTYNGESGGLNEANSDIMGTMVEFYANITDPTKDTPDYLIGEEIYMSNVSGAADQKALRYMFNPSLEGAGRSVNCWYSGVGSLDVHYSSGPANHFFYILAEGTTDKSYSGVLHHTTVCSGPTSLAGVGRDKASKIWYRAVRDHMSSGTNYAGARVATLQAADDMIASSEITAADKAAVAAAWSAVSVN